MTLHEMFKRLDEASPHAQVAFKDAEGRTLDLEAITVTRDGGKVQFLLVERPKK